MARAAYDWGVWAPPRRRPSLAARLRARVAAAYDWATLTRDGAIHLLSLSIAAVAGTWFLAFAMLLEAS